MGLSLRKPAPSTHHISIEVLRRFILLKQGLFGAHRFSGKLGALEYVRQAGCIQFDPINPCGRNAELTLQSRVKGFKKQDLYDLLYKDRALIDYPDKELSILPVEAFPYLSRWRESARRNAANFEGIDALADEALLFIEQNGPVSSATLPIEGEIKWNSAVHWSGNWHGKTNAARSVLEQMYTDGRLVIHHKDGTRKFYDLAERHIPSELLNAADPNETLIEHIKWCLLRRIGAVGLLWDRRSDSLLGIWGMNTELRKQAFSELEAEGLIIPLSVPEIPALLYTKAEDLPLLEAATDGKRYKKRCEFIAPLDPLMWDRNLIEALFGFRYRWEVYVPAEKRQYGYYVLPIVYGEEFIGRIEATASNTSKELIIKGLWFEPGIKASSALSGALYAACERLSNFNGCSETTYCEAAQRALEQIGKR
ncbi:MAG: YcaQ family DNA glycosylase [Clostridia bacterium]|nr:YcaQ family DNA glycosylase [Clostridia bacterium]